MTALLVRDPGALSTVQDLGRPGRAHLGVPRSGAADRGSLRLANRLVGNAEGAAALEVLGGGAVLEATADVVLAVTGARCEVSLDDRPQGRHAALALRTGEVLRLGPALAGIRVYVGVRGGVAAPVVLGSRSYDQLGALGPPPLVAGQHLALGTDALAAPVWEGVPVDDPTSAPVLTVTPGPRLDWLDGGLRALVEGAWSVSPHSDRTGVRLDGRPVSRRPGDLPSEGTVVGGVQVPPDGRPIVLGPDAGVTGGYPLVAVVVETDLDVLGQLAPGAQVRFRAR
jgi:biotin-dependent carboxylase-like uncharacterized protein